MHHGRSTLYYSSGYSIYFVSVGDNVGEIALGLTPSSKADHQRYDDETRTASPPLLRNSLAPYHQSRGAIISRSFLINVPSVWRCRLPKRIHRVSRYSVPGRSKGFCRQHFTLKLRWRRLLSTDAVKELWETWIFEKMANQIILLLILIPLLRLWEVLIRLFQIILCEL